MFHYHMIVKGQVQGVGFRYYTMKNALQYHIVGWVRNLENGDVEIHAQGEEELIRSFTQQIKKGPRFSSVESVHITSLDPQDFDSFHIA